MGGWSLFGARSKPSDGLVFPESSALEAAFLRAFSVIRKVHAGHRVVRSRSGVRDILMYGDAYIRPHLPTDVATVCSLLNPSDLCTPFCRCMAQMSRHLVLTRR